MNEYAQLLRLGRPLSFRAWSSIAGKKEGEGPLGKCFDSIEPDSHLGRENAVRQKSPLRCLHDILQHSRRQESYSTQTTAYALTKNKTPALTDAGVLFEHIVYYNALSVANKK